MHPSRVAALLLLVCVGCAGTRTPRIVGSDRDKPRIHAVLEPVRVGDRAVRVDGLPTDLGFLPDPEGRRILLIADKGGRLIATDLGTGETATIVEVADVNSCYVEDGLLGFALHPDHPTDPRLFVLAIVGRGADKQTVVRELTLAGTFPQLSVAGRATLFALPRERVGHNGGQLRFGPDGALYASFGDGGSQRDPDRQSSDPSTWHGTIARFSVDGSGDGPSVHAYGFRNPWRFDFADDGRLVLADAGQGRWEEVDLVEAGGHLGWSLREGPECFGAPARAQECADACARGDDLVDPIHSYSHADGLAIIGGVFGAAGGLAGRFVFGDNASGRLWALELPSDLETPRGCPVADDPGPTTVAGVAVYALGDFDVPFTAFARDPDGGVLVAGQTGRIFRIVTD